MSKVTFSHHGTTTGRFSSRMPNMSSVPRTEPEVKLWYHDSKGMVVILQGYVVGDVLYAIPGSRAIHYKGSDRVEAAKDYRETYEVENWKEVEPGNMNEDLYSHLKVV